MCCAGEWGLFLRGSQRTSVAGNLPNEELRGCARGSVSARKPSKQELYSKRWKKHHTGPVGGSTAAEVLAKSWAKIPEAVVQGGLRGRKAEAFATMEAALSASFFEEIDPVALPKKFALSEQTEGGMGAARRLRRVQRSGGSGGDLVSEGGRGPPSKRVRGVGSGGDAGATEDATGGEEERWRLLQQLSQVLPAAVSFLPDDAADLSSSGSLGGGGLPTASASLDWDACNRALDRLIHSSKQKEATAPVAEGASASSSSGYLGLFDLPLSGGGASSSEDLLGSRRDDDPGVDSLWNAGEAGASFRKSVSRAADPMKERQRRELQQRRTLDLASQIVLRFRGARRPGVLQLLHRFFSCSSKQVRDPQELEKLVGACCYIIARQQGDDMSLNDITAQLERRQGTKGRQRCRCISRWVVKVCGKLQLRCLPRHRDAEALASNALRRICSHLKLLLTQQERQELLLLQHLKDAYKQCLLQQEGAETPGGSGGSSSLQRQKEGGGSLAELDDEDLLRLLLQQQQQEETAAEAAAAAASAANATEDLPDVDAFLQQFDLDCDGAKKTQHTLEDEAWAQPPVAAAADSANGEVFTLSLEGAIQKKLAAAAALTAPGKRSSAAANSASRSSSRQNPAETCEEAVVSEEGMDGAALDAQIQQHECVLRLLRLLPNAQRIKLDHSIWLQKQRKVALQQLCEQSALVVKCVGFLQQLTAAAFAAAAKRGSFSLPAVSAGSGSSSSRGGDSADVETQTAAEAQQAVVPLEDPLDEHWRACGRCDAISTAANFVIVFECLQVPVFQRVVLEALEVDRRSVYKRRREQLQLAIAIFKRSQSAALEEVTIKTLGPLLIKAVHCTELASELLQIAASAPLPGSAAEGLDGSGGSEGSQSSCERSSSVAASSNEHEMSRASEERLPLPQTSKAARSHSSPRSATASSSSSSSSSTPPAALACSLNSKGNVYSGDLISSAAAAAALRELEEGDFTFEETPMARVVSLQYERTQQRWVCKWREGVGTAGRWHRRCFSVVKYGEQGAHTLAAAVAKRLRDRRNQEANGLKASSNSCLGGGPPPAAAAGAAGAAGAGVPAVASSESGSVASQRCATTAGSKGRPKRNAVAAASHTTTNLGGGATGVQEPESAFSLFGANENQRESLLLASLPPDPNLSTVVASAAYSDEMERLAQLLHKARRNPVLAKWLDERAPPPGPAELRAAAQSIVPFLALQTSGGSSSKEASAGASSQAFGVDRQPLPRRGRVAGAREGM
ncbi:uncharacterized protein LOC34618910 [Cyclospora cayetanensis]|uniref:Uncharacterized protein LOC34618910 n=1 Tax=Cyclospora cayetanensis TaxID=88456 RepID=A0A6P6RRL2_9EIME|nr:uncharacterized protein LOC34618910 [Cyclospora cayetanensis]